MPGFPPLPLIVLAGAFGAFVMPLYALSVAHASDRAEREDFVVVGSGVLMLFGVGSAIGSPLAGVAMGLAGNPGLFLLVAAALVMLAVGVAWRRTRVDPVHIEHDQPFVAVSEFAPSLDLDTRTEDVEPAPPDAAPDTWPEERRSAG